MLTIYFLVSLLPSLITAAVFNHKECWSYEYGRSSNTFNTKFRRMKGRICVSHCFELNQKYDGCSVAAVNFYWVTTPGLTDCLRNDDGEAPDRSKFRRLSANSYILKDECKSDACWSISPTQYGNLKQLSQEVPTEKECRFICLETKECFHASYHDGKCYIEYDGIVLKSGDSPHGDVYQVTAVCKRQSCWNKVHKEEIIMDQLVPKKATSDFECRLLCVPIIYCIFYKWNESTKECFIIEETGSYRGRAVKTDKWTYYHLTQNCISNEIDPNASSDFK